MDKYYNALRLEDS